VRTAASSVDNGHVSPAPDSAQRDAAHRLQLDRRMREVEASILSRAPEHDLEPSLDRIRAVLELLGDPQQSFPVIHVTGTNGKTSTARIIEAILRELGLKTGRFTSPHLHSMLERIAVGGRPVDAERFLAAYDEVIPFVEMVDARSIIDGGPAMTYFEVLVAVAYAAFADLPVDVAVVEVGMGGSWDATNVVEAPVSVVTPIDLDHRHFLGDTVEEIAGEKAGIIKTDAITVVGLQQAPEAVEVLVERATEVGARILFEGNEFGVTARDVALGGQQISLRGLAGEYPQLFLPLHGTHQAQNAAVAVAAVEAFLGGGEQALDVDVLRAGLATVDSPGRLEIVRRSPTVLVDAAHNPAGARALRDAIQDSFTFARLIGVVAVMKDKEAAEMLEVLESVLDEVVVTRTTSPRAMSPRQLGEIATEVFGDNRVTVVDELPEALDTAAGLADAGGGVSGGVLATGSVVTAAEVRMLLGTTSV
jgi:dihydrofolate synthase/folylpolyglutamate synthase